MAAIVGQFIGNYKLTNLALTQMSKLIDLI